MSQRLAWFVVLSVGTASAAETKPKPLAEGLKNPTAVCIGPDGRTYVATMGESGLAGDGSIVVLADGKAVPFATGLDDPSGMVVWNNMFFVADKTAGASTVRARPSFTRRPRHSR